MQTIKETIWAGKVRHHFLVTDSTNEQAKRLAREGVPHGTLVTADAQTKGKGRRGRTWESEQANGIYMSIILKPDILPEDAPMITLVAALAVSSAIKKQLKNEKSIPLIKWPNDIVINKKKICGILTEMELEQGTIAHIIVGIGVNVSHQEFPKEIGDAGSILLETGEMLQKEALLEEILVCFEHYFACFSETRSLKGLQKEYESVLVNKGRQVQVLEPNGSWEGRALGITEKGELMVDTKAGYQYVSSGEVSVRGVYGYV
uniref:biotin--[acetyl-CoA-carboxylase] ligase n=1 Tax=Agathobacter sp. TaxID=2021311 RepID=UPI0040575DBB